MTADRSARHEASRLPLVLHFEGPAVARHRLQLREFLVFGREIQTALDRVARLLQGEEKSVQPGRRLAELERACSLDMVSFEGGGSVTLTLDLPSSAQRVLPTFQDVGEEALRALVAGLDDVSEQTMDLPAGYDDGVLMALREAGKTFDRGIDSVTISLGTDRTRLEHRITRDTVTRIVRRIQTPVSNQKSVEGRLLMADFKDASPKCRVHPLLGDPIVCEFDDTKREAVLSGLTHLVRIVGNATEIEGEIRSLRIQDIEILDGDGVAADLGPPIARFEAKAPSLESLGNEGTAETLTELTAMAEGIWPVEDDVDEFIRTVRKWRKEGGPASSL